VEDYYRSLEMRLRMLPMTAATLERAAQLTQKTNQFNLTTRRYTAAELAAAAAAPGVRVWTAQVIDRFGDNGIVGVLITRPRDGLWKRDGLGKQDGLWEIDTFLLSCRVIGRTVETAMLALAAAAARTAGVARLTGWFRPTKKNAPAEDVYSKHGFTLVSQEEGGHLWSRPLAEPMAVPEWISIEENEA
jgi:FkbH-like protein